MLVFRVTRAKHTSLDGEAAKLYGGRWNHPGSALVYTAGSRALALLETRVHLTRPPRDYVCMVIEIPFEPVDRSDEIRATRNWRTRARYTKDFGSLWCRTAKECVLKVPSVVVPDESNYLINPAHSQMAQIRVLGIQAIKFDPRLWTVIR